MTNEEIETTETQQHEMPFALIQGAPLTDLPKDLYIPPDALEVFLEAFEGPLDLLLYLIKKQNIDIGREAMRVDYNEDGTIELNSDVSHNPEAWIVQIQSIEKEIFPVAPSDLNKVQF